MYLIGFRRGLVARAAARRAARLHLEADDVDDLIFFAMLGVILGGRIGYVLFYGMQFWLDDPLVSASRSGKAACPSTAACSAC